jgi:CHAT domain-containing protein
MIMRRAFVLAVALIVPQAAWGGCGPVQPVAPSAQPTALSRRFEALITADKFRDVGGNAAKWQTLIDDLKKDPVPQPALLARSYGWLAWSLDYVDKVDAALIAAKEAKRIVDSERLTEEPYHADVLTSLAMVETDLGQVDEATGHAQEALALAVRLSGAESAEASFAHNGLANAVYARGQYDRAEQEFRASTEIAVKCLAADNPFIVNQMASHAGTLYMAGRSEDALAENERAANWALTHLTEESPVVTLTLGNLGVMLRSAGRYAEAEAALRRVVDLEGRYQRENWYYRAISLSNFASVIDIQGRHQEAEALWLQSREFHAKSAIKRDPATSTYPLRFAADAAQARGDLTLALARRAEAIAIMAKDALPDHPELARARIEYALSLMVLKRADEALAAAEPAIKVIQTKLTADDTKRMTAEIAYARVVAAVSGPEAGYQIAAPIAARLEVKLLDTATARGDLLRYGPLFSASFAAVTELALASHRDEAAFRAMQLSNLSDIVVVSADTAARAASGTPEASALIRTLQDKIRERQSLDRARTFAASANQPAELARLEIAIKANDALITATDTALDRLFPAYRALGRPAPVSLDAFRSALMPDQILVAPLAVDNGLLAIAVTRSGLVWQKTPLLRSGADALVARVRASIAGAQFAVGALPPFDVPAARSLYQAIIPAKLASTFLNHPAMLYYASGALATLPPALLVGPGPAKRELAATPWLIRTHNVTVVPTLSAPSPSATAALRSASFLGIGAPLLAPEPVETKAGVHAFRSGEIDQKALRDLPVLPKAAEELANMEVALGGSANQMLIGAEATEARVKSAALARFNVIAIATHGLVGGDFAGLTEPALVMTPPEIAKGTDDGLLTASEIAGLKLDADWVILSACSTASGTGAGSPAYSGLASAFMHAGARALLVSHWPVRDDAAERLTVGTLRGVQAGQSRAAALQRAMLQLLGNRTLRQAAHPAIWAPFVLIAR